ncbi:MAG: extracellular solute-binding protein [Eubacterium sp.]|nr:extracellular solute-binding protein [Eubacterium sp.]
MKKRENIIMKKRLIAGTLAMTMMLGTAGCGKGKEAESGSGKAGAGKGTEESVDVKNCTFEEDPDFNVDLGEGSIGGIVAVGDGIAYSVDNYPDIPDDIDGEMIVGDEVVAEGAEDVETADGAADTAADDEAADAETDIETADDASDMDADMADFPMGNCEVHLRGADGSDKVIFESEQGTFIRNMTESGDNIALQLTDDNNKSVLTTIDKEGKEVSTVDLSALDKISENDYVSDIKMTKDGDLLAFCNQKVVVIDKDGKEKKTIDTQDYIMGGVITQSDDILIFTYGQESASIEAKKVDIAGGSLGEGYKIKGSLTSNTLGARGSGDYDFFYIGDNGLYGFKKDSQENVKLCDFNASYVEPSYINKLVIPDEEHFIIMNYNYSTGEPSVGAYRKVDPANVTEKKVLKLASLYANNDLKQAVMDFNKAHTDIRIDIVEYMTEEDPMEKMSADIAAGNIPDLYDTSYGIGNMSLTQAAQKGLLEDLTPYIEKDADISEDDFIDSVINAAKIDGKLYYIPAQFAIMTMLASKKDVGDKTGWTFDEMKQYIDSKPEDVRLFEDNSKSTILMYLTYTCLPQFVDFEKNECNFDSDDFKSLLELANRGVNDEAQMDMEMGWTEDIQNGKQLFIVGTISPDFWAIYDSIYNGDAACIGFPDPERKGTYAQFLGSIGMSQACSDKDLAWEFIKFNVSREQMGKSYSKGMTGGMPTRKDMFELYLKAQMTTESYTDEFGNNIEPVSGGIGMGNISVDLKPITEAEAQQFRDLTDAVSRSWETDESIFNIIDEESKAFFAGDKSADETAKTIQNRASTYLNESK